ncbi:uncharacterized protein G2W53_022293 [Senna tora]|uniref:Uncharacterized protein n=1 Tax=Senna tora TaxID=362788 RepID=A0A834WP19_9FABA|nr:uncharacterized protein G2W53_022293 [Senna tora]
MAVVVGNDDWSWWSWMFGSAGGVFSASDLEILGEAIKQIYKLLNVPQEKCGLRALKDEENPNYDQIAKELGCADAKA